MTLTASTVKVAQRPIEKPLKKSILLKKKKKTDGELATSQEYGGSMQKAPSILVDNPHSPGNLLSGPGHPNTGQPNTGNALQVSAETLRRGSVRRRVSIVDPATVSSSNKRHSSSIKPNGPVPDRKNMKTENDNSTVSGTVTRQRQEALKSLDLLSLKFKGQTLADRTGQNRSKKANTEATSNFMRFPRRRSTINLYSNSEALDVLSSIQEQVKIRKQEAIKGQLDKIKQRVQRTLDNVGMELESESEDEENLGPGPKPLHATFFDVRAEREKMTERNYIIGKVDTFEEKALLKKQYLTELAFWFEEHLDMCNDVITPDEMKDLIMNTQEIHTIISKSLKTFMKDSEEVVEKGKLLLEETSKIIADRKDQMSKKTKKERIIVYDDKILLQDHEKWELATKTVISVFEDSQKMIRNVMFRNALKLSQRQFEHIVSASEKRNKDLDDKKKQCIELQGKLHSAKIQNDRAHREMDEQRRKMDKLLNELNDTKLSVEKHQTRIKELNQDIYERNSKIKLLEEQLAEKMKPPTPPPTPPPPPEPETVFVKVVDSATQLRLEEVEAELEEAQAEIKKLQDELRLITEKLLADRERCKELQERITELESIPTPEPVIVTAPPTPNIETPPDTSDKDAQYFKTLMAGMKKDFAAELEKVKAHIVKEKSRGEAGARKMELQHKEQLNNIQKDIVRMLRGILHFRDSMMTCLEKENLFDQAQSLQDLGDFLKDKMSPDPRELLAVIVSTVIDYLHNMEGILNNAFKAMRILMRYQIDRQVEAEVEARMAKFKHEQETKKVAKEVQKKQQVLVGAKKDVKHLAKRLKKAKNKLKRFQKELEHAPNDKRYKDLLLRYNHIITLYKNMSKEMENLQSDFHETMQKKLEEKETMVVTQIKLEMKQQRAITEEQLKISILDKKENLRLLGRAFEENKISKDLYKMASSMIEKAIELPRLKLRNLFEQYITFRTVQESKDRVQQVLHDDKSEVMNATRREMELYMDQMDMKLDASMDHWRMKMKHLDIEKQELNKRIYDLFNEVLLETGILLIHPLLRNSSKRNIMAQATGSVTRKKMNQLLFKHNKLFKTFMDMPELIQGSSVPLQCMGKPMWSLGQPSHPPSEPIPRVVDPHMLAYEINGPQMHARQMHRRNALFRRNTLTLNTADSFHINDGNLLQNIRDCSFQHVDPLYTNFGMFPPICFR